MKFGRDHHDGCRHRRTSDREGWRIGDREDFNGIETITTAPDATIYFTDGPSWKVRAIRSTLPALTSDAAEITIADGSLLYVFNQRGRHLRTVHADTGSVLYEFAYSAGLLATITDHDERGIRIRRSQIDAVDHGARAAYLSPIRAAHSERERTPLLVL